MPKKQGGHRKSRHKVDGRSKGGVKRPPSVDTAAVSDGNSEEIDTAVEIDDLAAQDALAQFTVKFFFFTVSGVEGSDPGFVVESVSLFV